MLPVINEMEQEPFKHSPENHFNGVRYTLRNGFLQSQCVANNNQNQGGNNPQNTTPNLTSSSSSPQSIETNGNGMNLSKIINHAHSDINNMKNLSVWVCTGTKKQCQLFRNKLLHRNISNNIDNKKKFELELRNDNMDDSKSNGVLEIPLNLNNVLIPFMNSLSNGSQNTNLYFNVYANKINENQPNVNQNGDDQKQLQLRFLPLDSLPIQNQINTKRLSFKVLSCGTFKRNLQPMVCINVY